jgi:hypothetical protein
MSIVPIRMGYGDKLSKFRLDCKQKGPEATPPGPSGPNGGTS